MPRQPREPRIDPRSPVQPGRSPAPYFVLALFAAILVWTAQQYWVSDSGFLTSRHDAAVERPQGTSSPATESRGDVRTVFTADDYPESALRRGEEGTVQARLSVDSTGLVTRCDVIRSSGSTTLDEATCSILRRRARFTPARDRAGRSIGSTVVTPPVKWQLEP